MEEAGGKCTDNGLPKDQMEGCSSGCFDKVLSQGKAGGRRRNEKVQKQNQMGERPSEEEQSEDIEWLSTLSHSELDMLISLKELAILRARNAGCEEVADKFDLRMLRALGSVVMEYLSERVQSASIFPDCSKGFELLSGSHFATKKHEKGSRQLSLAENVQRSSCSTRKRLLEGSRMVLQSYKKLKVEDSSL